MAKQADSYRYRVWQQYRRHPLGLLGLWVVAAFVFVGIYAPFLASSKPIIVRYAGEWYFPLFRYLFFRGFYTTPLDLFFNLLIFAAPLSGLIYFVPKRWWRIAWLSLLLLVIGLFIWLLVRTPQDPASDPEFTQQRLALKNRNLSWDEELRYLNPYARLNRVLEGQQRLRQHERLQRYAHGPLSSLWQLEISHESDKRRQLQSSSSSTALQQLQHLKERRTWLDAQQKELHFEWMPLIRPFHWQEDAGGDDTLNQQVPWWELTRSGHGDLTAALIFGVRVSLIVGLLAVGLALAIGVPIGCFAGFYGGWVDIAVCRLMEIWEAMPTFFMLLFVVAILQTKSMFLVILVIGIFGWTGFSRYLRGEFLKQRQLPYVEACRAMGFNDALIMFHHILPNAIPPVLTLLPFAIMGAISAEAGLSFLGLGEAGSCSWGVLMDEGRQAFPSKSYLLWPPAILLTVLLVAIALVGDALRDAIDPRLHQSL